MTDHQTKQETTHFGFTEVPVAKKAKKVAEVFDSVALQYDKMNDLMSLGAHRLWKRLAIQMLNLRPGHNVLDLAGGTGDLTARISPLVGDDGKVVLADINHNMLTTGRRQLLDRGIFHNIKTVQADAQHLPFPKNSFDRIIIGFGLRNVTDKDAALRSMYRVLKPGGLLLVLEFSTPTLKPLKPIYDAYSFKVLPLLGKLIAKDANSYRYLAESIRMHPNQNKLLSMLKQNGFDQCQYRNLSGGIVAIHTGYKY